MKKNKIFLILFFLFISFVTFSASYRISNLSIIGVLNKDGSMEVHENIVYDIDEINGILFDIDAKGYGGIASLKVFEDVGEKDGKYKYKEVDPSRYEISEDDGLYKIKLYSKNKNNTRAFAFVYKLPEAVKVYNDVAQFNRKMVGQNWQQSIYNVLVQIWTPVDKNYDNSKILAFGHGPLTGDIIKENNVVQYNLEDYYPGDFVEAHILMEPEIFSEVSKDNIIQKNMKQELLDMEKELADEANAIREKALKREEALNKLRKYDKPIFGAEVGIWLSIMYYIHRKFKKKNKYKDIYGKYLRELPDDYSPSLAGTIITNTPNDQEILATLLDLIRRKEVILDEERGKNKLTLKEDAKLSAQEKIIADIYFNDFGNGKSVVLEDIKGSRPPLSVAKKFEKWQYSVLSSLDKKNFTYESLGFLKGVLFVLIGLGFFIGAMFHIIIFENPIFILLAFMGFILIASALSAKRPADELQKAKARWGAFKNFLEDYSQLEEAKISSIHLWEQYFVYAVAMGVSEKVVKAYKKALEMGQVSAPTSANANTLGTLSLMDMYSRGNFARSINTATKSTYNRSMTSISKSRRSSSSGGGGGFSSGSSGGGGSRGGGGAF